MLWSMVTRQKIWTLTYTRYRFRIVCVRAFFVYSRISILFSGKKSGRAQTVCFFYFPNISNETNAHPYFPMRNTKLFEENYLQWIEKLLQKCIGLGSFYFTFEKRRKKHASWFRRNVTKAISFRTRSSHFFSKLITFRKPIYIQIRWFIYVFILFE